MNINIKQMRENASISNSDLSNALDYIEQLEAQRDSLFRSMVKIATGIYGTPTSVDPVMLANEAIAAYKRHEERR